MSEKQEVIGKAIMSKLMEKDVYNAAVSGDLTILSNKNKDQLLKKTYQNNNILHIAAQQQQLKFIKAALNNFPSTPTSESLICDQNCHGNTPLHIAAEVGDEAVVDLLFEFFSKQCAGRSKSSKQQQEEAFPWRVVNEDGNTPAHVALLYGHVSVAMYLVDRDDYVSSVVNRSQQTLLHLAIQYRLDDYKSQKTETQEPTRNKNAYQPAGDKDLWSIVEQLLELESSTTCWKDTDGLTPLHRAASLEPTYCIRVIKAMLVSYPESGEIRDKSSGATILHLLTNHQVDSYETGKELLEIPQVYALGYSKNHQGDTPLHLAASNRDTIMVRVLLECFPKLAGLRNKSGVSAGSLLQQLEPLKIRKNLIKDKDRPIFTEEEYTAVKEGNAEFLQEKLESFEMNFWNAKSLRGSNILHFSMRWGLGEDLSMDEAEALIGPVIKKLPSLISEQDCNGNTPIHVLMQTHVSYSLPLLELICKYFDEGPREEVGSHAGGAVQLLPWKLKNEEGDTPLHAAITRGLYDAAMKLVELDKEVVSYVNNSKQTPLHLLSFRNSNFDADKVDNLARCLINENEELPYMQDEDGLTPLLVAVQDSNIPMICKLYEAFPSCLEIADFEGRNLWHVFVSQRFDPDNLTAAANGYERMKESCEFLITPSADDNYRIFSLMGSVDNDGNTPLHLAIENQHFSFVVFFLQYIFWGLGLEGLELTLASKELLKAENKKGVSSYDLLESAPYLTTEIEIFMLERGGLLAGHRSITGVPATKIEEYANTIGIIAALLVTITFTAAFTVPGGVDSSNGTPLLLQKAVFQVFMVADVLAMCSSMMVLFCLLLIMTSTDRVNSLYLLDTTVFMVRISFFATIVTFMTGLYVTTIKIAPAIAISTCVICTLLTMLMQKKSVRFIVVPFVGLLMAFWKLSGFLIRRLRQST